MEQVFRYRYSENVTPEGVEITLSKFIEVKKTPAGAWVEQYFAGGFGIFRGPKFFVRDGTGKRRCHQTKEQAWNSFRIRKQRQKFHAELTAKKAAYALEQMERLGTAPDDTVLCGSPAFMSHYTFD